jgi:hypothetical protein
VVARRALAKVVLGLKAVYLALVYQSIRFGIVFGFGCWGGVSTYVIGCNSLERQDSKVIKNTVVASEATHFVFVALTSSRTDLST